MTTREDEMSTSKNLARALESYLRANRWWGPESIDEPVWHHVKGRAISVPPTVRDGSQAWRSAISTLAVVEQRPAEQIATAIAAGEIDDPEAVTA